MNALYRVRADDGTDVTCDFDGAKGWVGALTKRRQVAHIEPLVDEHGMAVRAETCGLCGQPEKPDSTLNDSLQGGLHPGCLRDEVAI